MPTKRLVIFAEGEGDAQALPVLLPKLLTHRFMDDWHEWLFIDPDTFRIKGIDSFGSSTANSFKRWVKVAQNRGDFGGLIVILDADSTRSECHLDDVRKLRQFLLDAGAGSTFPAAIVLLQREYEALLIASCNSLIGLKADVATPDNIESIRGCKEWLNRNLKEGYAPIPYQEVLTRQISIDLVKAANLRSFRRLQHALEEMHEAIKSGTTLLTPLL